MSFVNELGPHLPFLRRYARALTGSQNSGDAHVRAALEAAIADRSVLDTSLPARVALYRLFHAVWNSAGATLDAANDEGEAGSGPEDRLRRLPPVSRQALLLTAMENFSGKEAAQILGLYRPTLYSKMRKHGIDDPSRAAREARAALVASETEAS